MTSVVCLPPGISARSATTQNQDEALTESELVRSYELFSLTTEKGIWKVYQFHTLGGDWNWVRSLHSSPDSELQ